MPNWCYNQLKVTGPTKDIIKFKKIAKAKESDLSLAKLYPEPNYDKEKVKPTFPGLDKKFGKKRKYVNKSEAWWDWRVQKWGTKWDVDATLEDFDIDDKDGEGYLYYAFDSAWSPPIGWLKYVAKHYPYLEFRLKYDEQGMCFMGMAQGKEGKVKDKCIEY